MADPIDFFFDFSSPYGYFAAEAIEPLAERFGRRVTWRPVLLGVIFKGTGAAPLMNVPVKGEYARRDWQRISALTGIAYQEPTRFPIPTQAAARALLYGREQQPERAGELARAWYRAYFAQGRDLSDPAVVLDIGAEQGLDRSALEEAIESAALKDALKAEVILAQSRGVFGSPFVVVDDEPFWGWDRLPMVAQWLQSKA